MGIVIDPPLGETHNCRCTPAIHPFERWVSSANNHAVLIGTVERVLARRRNLGREQIGWIGAPISGLLPFCQLASSPQRRCRAVGEKSEITVETVTLTRLLSSFDLRLNLMSLSYTQANQPTKDNVDPTTKRMLRAKKGPVF